MDERAFYSESQTTKPATLHCPYCHSSESYDLHWVVRRCIHQNPAVAAVIGGSDIEMPHVLIGDCRISAEEGISSPVIVSGYDDWKHRSLNSED